MIAVRARAHASVKPEALPADRSVGKRSVRPRERERPPSAATITVLTAPFGPVSVACSPVTVSGTTGTAKRQRDVHVGLDVRRVGGGHERRHRWLGVVPPAYCGGSDCRSMDRRSGPRPGFERRSRGRRSPSPCHRASASPRAPRDRRRSIQPATTTVPRHPDLGRQRRIDTGRSTGHEHAAIHQQRRAMRSARARSCDRHLAEHPSPARTAPQWPPVRRHFARRAIRTVPSDNSVALCPARGTIGAPAVAALVCVAGFQIDAVAVLDAPPTINDRPSASRVTV